MTEARPAGMAEEPASYNITPMRLTELDTFIDIYSIAFQQPEADMIMPMMYPNVSKVPDPLLDPKVHARLRHAFDNDDYLSTDRYIVARHVDTETPIAVCWWTKVPDPPQTHEEIDEALHEGLEKKRRAPVVPGMNTALEEAYYRASFTAATMYTNQKRYWELRILAVLPGQQGKGIGAALLKESLERIDSEGGWPLFVIASTLGKPLYEKFGFETVGELALDPRDYGGHSKAKHWCMLRPGRVNFTSGLDK